MTPGVITAIFTRSRTPVSWLIRATTRWGPWSHVGVVNGDEVIEALAFKGVVVTPLSKVVERSSEVKLVDFYCPEPMVGMMWAQSSVGTKYDWGGALGIPFRQRNWQQTDRWYCSEHLEYTLILAGRPRFRRILDRISPNDSYVVL